MKNPIKIWKERRERKRRLKDNAALAFAFGTFDKFAQGGLLWFDEKPRRLMIERSLAVLMMKDADTWVHFLSMVSKWQYLKQCQQAWNEYIHKEEQKAVRRALNKYASMSRRDIERVKDARRAEILQSDMQPPKVEPFEFFVIGPEVKEEAQATTPAEGTAETSVPSASDEGAEAIPGGTIHLVGHFDPNRPDDIEMATWEEVSLFLGGGE